MSKKAASFIIESHGVVDFYYSTRCFIEKTGHVTAVTFEDSGMSPPDVLTFAVSPRTISVYFAEYVQDDETVASRLEYFDFEGGGGKKAIQIDFKAFKVQLLKENAQYLETDYGIRLEFRGFLTKESRKTDTLRFFIEIRKDNLEK